MRRVGQARKRDANERPIVDGLRGMGFLVFQLSGEGVPDLLVWFPRRRQWFVLDVKSENGKLTKKQTEAWVNCDVPTVETIEEALDVLTNKPRGTHGKR